MMNMPPKNKKILLFSTVAVILLILVTWIIWGNSALELNTYTVSSDQLPKAFDGYRIAHVSDLHNAEMGKDNEKLLKLLKDAEPDMIAITGDLIDSRNTDTEIALHFVREAVRIAPCYYVTGNHEARVAQYSELKSGMEAAGVTILEDAKVTITAERESIVLVGVNDPSYVTDYLLGDSNTVMGTKLAELHAADHFTILLSHRPELFPIYVENNMDLVLSGHAHGGQFRLPFIGGLVAPHQGFFPEYDAGLYTEAGTSMIVSRGIGNSLFPFRVNNRPELIVIKLQTA